MQFINPLNNKLQVCNPYIYNKSKISKLELNNLIIYLYKNNRLKYTKNITLRILRNLPYKECCEILMTSDLKFITRKSDDQNYTNINCLDMSLDSLKNLAKNNFIPISNNKNMICNELVNLKYKFKDNPKIINNENINKMRLSIVDTNIMRDNQLPFTILIKQFGINIYTHTKKYIYIPRKFINNVTINQVNSTINLLLTNNIEYVLLYKKINSSKNIMKLYPKYKLDYNSLELYLNSIYSTINIKTPTKNNIIIWVTENCKNYDKCSEQQNINLLSNNKICVKNKFSNDYININKLIRLNDKKCYNIDDVKNLIKFDDINELGVNLTPIEEQYLISI